MSPYVWVNEDGDRILYFERIASPYREAIQESYVRQPILFRWVCNASWLEKVIRDGKLWLSRGASVAIFPEGTRSHDGEIYRFKAGAFTLAREAGVEILPVVLDGTTTMIGRNGMFNWRNKLTVSILPPVSAERVAAADPKELMEQVRASMCVRLAEIRKQK